MTANGTLLLLARLVVLGCVVALGVQGATQPEEQEDLPVQTTLVLGFDPDLPIRRVNSWTPVSALLENNGDPIKGQLVAQVFYGELATDMTYSCPVDLPTGSRKVYRLSVFLSGEGVEVQVRLDYDDKEFVLGQLAAPPLDDNFEIVAALTDQRDSLDFMGTVWDELAEEGTTRRMLYTQPRNLPSEWIAYQGLDTLVWARGPSDPPVQPEQLAAFRQWLTMGGRLVVFVGSLRQELADSPWSEYLPIDLTGTETLAAGRLFEGPALHEPEPIQRPLVISVGRVLESLNPRVLLRCGDIPVALEAEWGAGSVIYCAFEPQTGLFAAEPTSLHLWDILLAGLGSLPVSVTTQMDPTVSYLLRSQLQAELPSAWFIAGFLGLYIILVVPLNYLVFRRLKRLEWAWLMVPVWAIIFSVAAYYIGAIYQRGAVSYTELSVIETFPESTHGRSTSYMSIYSPVRSWYNVKFANRDVFPLVVTEMNTESTALSVSPVDSLSVQYGPDTTVIEDVLIHHWSQRVVKAAHNTEMGKGLKIDLRWEGSRLRGEIANQTPYTIRRPTLYVMDRRYNLGRRLESGDTCSIPESFQPYDAEQVEEEIFNVGRRRFRPRRWELDLGVVYRYWLDADPFGRRFSLVTGDVDRLLLRPELGRPVDQETGRALLAVLFNTYSWPRGVFTIPSDSWHFESLFATGTPFVAPSLDKTYQISSEESIEYAMLTDFNVRGAQVRGLRITPVVRELRYQGPEPQRFRGRLPSQRPRGRPISDPDDFPVFYIRNTHTKEWRPIQWKLTDSGNVTGDDIGDPHMYVKLRSGSLFIRAENPSEETIEITEDSLKIELDVEYPGSAGGGGIL